MSRQTIEEKTSENLEPIVADHGFEIVDIEYVKEGQDWYLRCYIDKEGGININDCEMVSRELEHILDEQDYIPDAYILEVSSPGLTRPLKKERDYERNLGKPVEVHTYKPVDGFREFIGDLLSYDKDTVTLDTGQDSVEEIRIQRTNIAVIKQYFVF